MRALLIIDIQYDFLPDGALAVPNGDEVIPVVNRIIPNYDFVVATQDFHPDGHKSFASAHDGGEIFKQIEWKGLPQTLWPDHCIQGTRGAELSKDLNTRGIATVVRKGLNPDIDSYSGFFDNQRAQQTELHQILQEKGVTELDVVGLATDYCVKFTVLDALDLGYKVRVITDACRGVDITPGDVDKALSEMAKAGAELV